MANVELKWEPLVLLPLGLLSLPLVIMYLSARIKFYKHCKMTKGIVKELKADPYYVTLELLPRRVRWSPTRFPLVVFADEHGRSYSFTGADASLWHCWQVGDVVTVLYDPDNPDRAEIDSDFLNRWLGEICVVFAILFSIASGMVILLC